LKLAGFNDEVLECARGELEREPGARAEEAK
jgi:hypothetical protein